MATDAGLVARSSTARVVVRVEDVNDHAPQFQRRSYVAQIPDGVAAGLGRITCITLSPPRLEGVLFSPPFACLFTARK